MSIADAYAGTPRVSAPPPQLAEARRRLQAGDLAGARALYLELIDQPQLTPLCLHDLGLVAALQGQHARAAGLFRQTLRLDPNRLEAYANLAVACEHSGDLPGLLAAWLEHGNALVNLGQRREAVELYRRLLDREPRHYAAAVNLGNSLAWLGEGEEAAHWLSHALHLLARTGAPLGALLEVIEARGGEAFPLDGQPPPDGLPVGPLDEGENALTTLARLLAERGFAEDALACHARIVQEVPGYAQGHWNYGLALLTEYDYARGWREYEWRWRWPEFPEFHRRLPLPVWPGGDPQGQHLLVWTEQGYGDAIQFLPLASRLLEQGARVTVETPQPLVRLFAANLPDIPVIARPERPDQPVEGEFDAMVPLMGLPFRLNLRVDALPLATHYLKPLPEDQAVWAERLADRTGLKVGLVWAGRAAHTNDARRSLAFDALAPLLEIPGVSWHSLQVGPASRQIECLEAVRDLAAQFKDFADTAAAIAALDLVIAVDTGVAHLAAAQGKPVWLLLPTPGDWRWGRETETTPWYPSVRIFRQARPGDWQETIARLRKALAQWAARR
ncbi:tetratricopeptide repeat protein [Acidihalobacter ferrooxydans]|uniref:Glycosyltransferase n=1 Tax=Acidihalobacter ferrooxydans TaxID=1765967 RepID=A0A1P8UF72_9GAMM|nr:tetratricopeptide repeat-containing glycosyltransferase family protein [Acidihalobacter ferrooxydans]APZ42468.1 hypothetical protein BW247_04665 [Acidihalobacter ferrooxydans]